MKFIDEEHCFLYYHGCWSLIQIICHSLLYYYSLHPLPPPPDTMLCHWKISQGLLHLAISTLIEGQGGWYMPASIVNINMGYIVRFNTRKQICLNTFVQDCLKIENLTNRVYPIKIICNFHFLDKSYPIICYTYHTIAVNVVKRTGGEMLLLDDYWCKLSTVYHANCQRFTISSNYISISTWEISSILNTIYFS